MQTRQNDLGQALDQTLALQRRLAFENILQAHALADIGTTDLVPTMYRTPRYGIATNQSIRCRYLVYEMENRIKEQQLALFADRTSSSKWWTNQYRVLLAAVAYTLLETMRRTALRGPNLPGRNATHFAFGCSKSAP